MPNLLLKKASSTALDREAECGSGYYSFGNATAFFQLYFCKLAAQIVHNTHGQSAKTPAFAQACWQGKQ